MNRDEELEKTLVTMATELGLIYVSDCLKPTVHPEEVEDSAGQIVTGKKEKNFSQLT